MFRAKGDGKYMDLFERAALNAFLSGSGMSGDLYFYPNPLASFGQHERTPWFTCACCPPNVARFIAEMGGFAYGTAGDKVYVNLYAAGTATVETRGRPADDRAGDRLSLVRGRRAQDRPGQARRR